MIDKQRDMKNTNDKVAKQTTEEFMDLVVQAYQATNSLSQTVHVLEHQYQLKVPYQKVRKILITAKVYENDISRRIQAMFLEGKNQEQIAEAMEMSMASVNGYLPYQKGKLFRGNAQKEENGYRDDNSKDSNKDMGEPVTLENLWDKVVAHQGETFYTKKKLPFSYTIKGGEMYTDRRERSITRSTFEAAFRKIEKAQGQVTGPKSLNVFGAPYVWAVLMGIGVKCD